MQPYFFPYLGYFQLINSVDIFIVYDDVNFKKRHWISRNRILLQERAHRLTLNLTKSSQNKKINEIEIIGNHEKLIKTIYHSYRKAPFFSKNFSIIQEILENDERNLAKFLFNSIVLMMKILGIQTELLFSSQISYNRTLNGQGKILDICSQLGADFYVNLFGGISLYNHEAFSKKGVKLQFLKCIPLEYRQFNCKFIPHLSIIDLLMHNSTKRIRELLYSFKLV